MSLIEFYSAEIYSVEVGSWIEARWRGKFVCASRKHDFSAPTEHDARGTIEQVLRGVAFGRKTERQEKGSLLETSRRGRSIFLDRLSSYRHILNSCGRGEGRIFDEKRETTRRRRVACSPLFRFGLIVVTSIVSKKAIWMERQRGIRSKGDRLDRVPPRGEARVNEA